MTQSHTSELTHGIAFAVESLPDITNDPGEMYSGMISIDDTDPTAQMFFVFEPTIGEPVNEITIWLNGVRHPETSN
jgi:carboxypeptidase D